MLSTLWFVGKVDTTVSTGRSYGAVVDMTYPTICAYLYYDDPRALDWLVDVFGFTVRMRDVRPDGSLGHCELVLGDSVVMLGTPDGYRGPDADEPNRFGLFVHVDDVEAHFARSRAKGARVQDSPTDQPYGVRSYGVLDLAGNQWWFAQPLAAAAST